MTTRITKDTVVGIYNLARTTGICVTGGPRGRVDYVQHAGWYVLTAGGTSLFWGAEEPDLHVGQVIELTVRSET